ncbi:hypothetical protein [Actinomycetospora succinea]|nr:hypothetical protein [Actinomycetospora succinea]
MLTAAEVRAEIHIRRLHDQTWEQVRNLLIAKWILVAVFSGMFLASGVPGLLIAGAAVAAMCVHHSRERRVWHELHEPMSVSLAPIAADEAARIIAEWEPPTVVIPAQPVVSGRGRHAA